MSIYNFFKSFLKGFASFGKGWQRKFLALTMPKKRHNRYAKSLGFTLLEILVVLAIAGILSAIAAPSWLSFTNNQRINSSQTKVFQAIKTAQSSAKVRQSDDAKTTTTATTYSKRTRIAFTLNSTSPALRLDNVTASGGDQSLDTGIVISSVLAPNTLPTDAQGKPYIEFDSRGFLYDQSLVPLCITLRTSNPVGAQKTRWVKIQTLLGAITTGADSTCTVP